MLILVKSETLLTENGQLSRKSFSSVRYPLLFWWLKYVYGFYPQRA